MKKKLSAFAAIPVIVYGASRLIHYYSNENPGQDYYEKSQWMQSYGCLGYGLTLLGILIILSATVWSRQKKLTAA